MSTSEAPRPEVSLIVPVYNEELNVPRFIPAIAALMDANTTSWEVVFVDDGSRDQSLALLAVLASQHRNVKVVSFARNFGKEIALTAGLQACSGKSAILIDCDLQHPPETIPEMIGLWRGGYQMVTGIRRQRTDQSAIRGWLSNRFYDLLTNMSSVEIQANAGDFRLIDRCIIDVLNSLPENARFMKGLYQWPGFSSTNVEFDVRDREVGESRWPFWKLWKLALDGIFSFSTLPLKIWTYVGIAVSLASFLYAGITVVQKVVWGIAVPGYASLLIVILLLGGVLLIANGIQGEYIARIYDEVKGRPLFVVKKVYGMEYPNHWAPARNALPTNHAYRQAEAENTVVSARAID